MVGFDRPAECRGEAGKKFHIGFGPLTGIDWSTVEHEQDHRNFHIKPSDIEPWLAGLE